MDNLNVHTNQLVIEAIESVGAKVLFLPTYSPELNPIEMLWSKLKAFLRKLKPRTRADLDVAVSTFIASLQQKDLLGYFLETEARTVFI
jgi:transposase